MKVGYKLFAEGYGPQELLRQAVAAERAGFDFVEVSDHFHPWLYDHGHSAFVWSLLGSIATATDRIGLATGVTCPSIRYHPADHRPSRGDRRPALRGPLHPRGRGG